MLVVLPATALALSLVGVQAMKIDFLHFPRRVAIAQSDAVHDEHHIHKRAPTYITNTTLPDTNYTYIGCYTDSTANRVLTHDISASIPGGNANMTILNCARAANASGYIYFGVEYSQECWADFTLATSSSLKSNASCSMTCKGNNTEWCGAGDFLQTYQLTSNITEIVYYTDPNPTATITPTTT
jgi:hypothetical protein